MAEYGTVVNGKEIVIEAVQINPPIPTAAYDWMAWAQGREEGPIGHGSSKHAAMCDLVDSLECYD